MKADRYSDQLKSMKGGVKQFFLKNHRKEVLADLTEYGPDATREAWNMKTDTWLRFLNPHRPSWERMSKPDRAMELAKMAIDSDRDTRRRIGAVEHYIEVEVKPVVNTVKALAVLVGKSGIPLPYKSSLEGEKGV